MTRYYLKYNPYTVTTELATVADDEKYFITEESRMASVLHERLQRWVEPHDDWKGFFLELLETCGDKQVEIEFVGTQDDLGDLRMARDKFAANSGITVDIVSKLNKAQLYSNSAQKKIIRIHELYTQLQEGKIDELKADDVKNAFESAVNSDFEVVVVAPVSAGKSTLQNALIGRRLLPVSNRAKTAVLTKVRVNGNLADFQVTAKRMDGEVETFEKDGRKAKVTQKLITELNDELDPADPEKQNALRECIYLEGPAERFDKSDLNLVFVDTPGGNNAMNERHRQVMEKALYDENKSLVVFVFTANTIDHDATKDALDDIADAMRYSMNGKLSQDRFLFVCNCADEIADGELAAHVEALKTKLAACGITDPNLFLVSARTAELIRANERNQKLIAAGRESEVDVFTEDDEDNLDSHCKKMSRDSKALYRYSSLPEAEKQYMAEKVQRLKAEGKGKGSPEIALIHSGIPAVEHTINEYLRKYAVPMKVEQMHESFMRKVRDRQMIDHCKERWASSDEELREARKQIAQNLEEYNNSKKLEDFRTRLKNIRLDKQDILNKQAKLKQQLHDQSNLQTYEADYMELDGIWSYWLEKKKAELYIRRQTELIEENLKKISEDMIRNLNSGIVQPCNDILKEYQEYIEQLNKSRIFDLAGLKIDALGEFKPYSLETVDLVIRGREEKVGTKPVPKSGFMNALKRFLGMSGGYDTVAVKGVVEYVDIESMRKNQLAKASNAFDGAVKEYIGIVEAQVQSIKSEVEARMNKLDAYIQSVYKKYLKELENGDRLKAEVEQNKKNVEWLDQFVKEVDKLLDIEEA